MSLLFSHREGECLAHFCIPIGNAVSLRREEVLCRINDLDSVNRVALRDRIDNTLAFVDFAEHSVLSVQPRSRDVGHEKLAAVGARTGVCHRKNSRTGVFEIRMNLVLELVARTAGTRASRVAALNHEVRDDAVKSESVVIALGGEVEVVGAGNRRFAREERCLNITFGCLQLDANIVHGNWLRLGFRESRR